MTCMVKPLAGTIKSRAEELFLQTKKEDKQILKEKEKAKQKVAEKTARLKALRLAKEAVENS